MKRCDECGGRFGLIIYRHFARRFCSRSCKELYLAGMRLRALAARAGPAPPHARHAPQTPHARWFDFLFGSA